MKRAGQLYGLISEPDNIKRAFLKAVKGKHSRKEVIEFKNDFDNEISDIRQLLIHQKPIEGNYRFFRIYDPKQREICVAPFSDRVLHHAIMNICESVFESYAIYDSYTCRKGKGTRKAVLRAGEYTQKYKWYLKLDIRKYFASIDQEIVMQLLSRRIKDRNVLSLFEKIISTYRTEPGKGLPIGNLISQHLANFYLSTFDHWIKEERRIKGYIRYMHDFIVFGDQKPFIRNELAAIKNFLWEKLKLKLKNNIQLNRCTFGIPFLGCRVFPGKVNLSSGSKKRFIQKFRNYEKNLVTGNWSIGTLIRHVEPLIEWTRIADTLTLTELRQFKNLKLFKTIGYTDYAEFLGTTLYHILK